MADSVRPTGDGRTTVQSSNRAAQPAQPVTPTRPPLNPDEADDTAEAEAEETPRGPRLASGCHGRRLVPADHDRRASVSPEQRLLILDAWLRSGLPAADFAPLVGLSRHTLYSWKKRFQQHGAAGLLDQPQGAPTGSKLSELTKRTILLLKQSHPDWGCQKISDMLLRGPALPACPSAVARVLREAGYQLEDNPAPGPHEPPVHRFERARPNQLWQTDLFTFILKRQNRRVFLVGFLDDHSRFITSYGLHASASTALVLETFRAGLDVFGNPEEVLTDNGSQYITWRGTSLFHKGGVGWAGGRPTAEGE